MSLKNIFLVLCILGLTSCTSESRSVEYYDLAIKSSSKKSLSDINVTTTGPSRQRMLFIDGVNMEVLEFNRWLDEPDRLLENKLKVYFRGTELGPELEVELLQFNYDAGQQLCSFSMSCDLKSRSTGKARTYRFDLQKPDVNDDPEDVALAMSYLVEQAFKELAEKL
jgi:hypothetical protein